MRGLLGAWRVDCTTPSSQSNGQLSYVVRDGALFFDRDFGGPGNSSPIVSAKVTDDGAIDLVIDFASLHQRRHNVLQKSADGARYRALASFGVDGGDATIKDGKLVSNGQVTQWQSRCN